MSAGEDEFDGSREAEGAFGGGSFDGAEESSATDLSDDEDDDVVSGPGDDPPTEAPTSSDDDDDDDEPRVVAGPDDDPATEAPTNSGTESQTTTPSNSTDSDTSDEDAGGREPSSEPVDEFDGRKTRVAGEDAPGNQRDATTVEVLDRSGDDGQPVTPPDDDPLVPDDGTGLEDRGVGGVATEAPVEPTTPEERALDESVAELQGRVDREVPGVRAIDTDAYNIRRTPDGGLTVELTDQGVEQVREATREEQPELTAPAPGTADPDDVVSGPGDDPPTEAPVGDTQSEETTVVRTADDPVTEAAIPGFERIDADALRDPALRNAVEQKRADSLRDPTLIRAEERARAEARRSSATDTDGLFAPDRAPDREASNPITGFARDVTGLPSERELVADLRAITGLPSERELRGQTNQAIESGTNINPRQSFERERSDARSTTLSTAANVAQRAQNNPAAALAVGGPVALAEPTPTGEAALLAGAVGGAVGIDVAGRIRSRQSELETPEERPGVGSGEVSVPEERPGQQSELETPEQRPRTQSELSVEEVEVAVSELDTPETEQRDPLVLRTAQSIGRQRGRQERSETERSPRRDRGVPERFIPDEEVTIGREEIEEPEVDRGRRFAGVERPEGGVRTFTERETSEPEVEPQQQQIVEPRDTAAGRGATFGPRLSSGVDDRVGVRAGLGPQLDQVAVVEPVIDTRPVQQSRLDARTRQDQQQALQLDQRQRQAVDQRTRVRERQRQRTVFETPTIEVEEPVAPGVGIGTAFASRRPRRPRGVDDAATERPSYEIPGGTPAADEAAVGANFLDETVAAFAGFGAEGREAERTGDPTFRDIALGTTVEAADTDPFAETSAFLSFGALGGDR